MLFLVSCSPPLAGLQTVELVDPQPRIAIHYSQPITVENITKDSTHIALVELKDIQPYGVDTGKSIFTFTIKSLLAGEELSPSIMVINPSSFYRFEETYLLFLNYWSSITQPFDWDHFALLRTGIPIHIVKPAPAKEDYTGSREKLVIGSDCLEIYSGRR